MLVSNTDFVPSAEKLPKTIKPAEIFNNFDQNPKLLMKKTF